MAATVKSGQAMVKVLESWGVKNVYGIPGGSFNSSMNALHDLRGSVRYVQVRHEETGAVAASVEAKLTGNIGVCFGSAGPGATHLFNGLYDAKMDNVPVLALIGQVASTAMNRDAFQEMNENPMFADVAVYNRTVMTPASLPLVVDEAIRRAVTYRSVAVVTIPVDYGYQDIPEADFTTALSRRDGTVLPDDKDIQSALNLIAAAQRPVVYAGQGARGSGEALLALSEHFSMPIVVSVLAKGIIPDDAGNFMGTAARVGTKPANEALAMADCILFIGSDFPFAQNVFPPQASFIQVDVNPAKLGKRHKTDVAILGEAGETMRRMVAMGQKRPVTPFLTACRQNRANWNAWLGTFASSNDVPMRTEPVFREINRIADADAIFVTDVGNCTVDAVRMLNMNGTHQRFTTSGWFATMGYGVPGGIAAKLAFPKRQVFTLNGDGGFAMAMQDVITQVKYRLPVINIVFSNDSFGFIEAEQEDTGQPKFGVLLEGADYAKAAEAMGAKGYTVTRRYELEQVFDEARISDKPVVIDVKIADRRPFPSEAMILDPESNSPVAIEAFKARYSVSGMPVLRELLPS